MNFVLQKNIKIGKTDETTTQVINCDFFYFLFVSAKMIIKKQEKKDSKVNLINSFFTKTSLYWALTNRYFKLTQSYGIALIKMKARIKVFSRVLRSSLSMARFSTGLNIHKPKYAVTYQYSFLDTGKNPSSTSLNPVVSGVMIN